MTYASDMATIEKCRYHALRFHRFAILNSIALALNIGCALLHIYIWTYARDVSTGLRCFSAFVWLVNAAGIGMAVSGLWIAVRGYRDFKIFLETDRWLSALENTTPH